MTSLTSPLLLAFVNKGRSSSNLDFLLIIVILWVGVVQWLDEHERLINDLRSAVNSHVGDSELRLLMDGVMSHYDEIFPLKSIGTKSDVFHILSDPWKPN